MKALLASVLACAMVLQMSPSPVWADTGTQTAAQQVSESQSGKDEIDTFSMQSKYKYEDYLQQYKNAASPADTYEVEAKDYTQVSGMEVKRYADYQGVSGTSVLTGESGWIEWTVNIRQAGLYNLALQYYPVEGKSADIGRAVYIDGKLPYAEAGIVELSRQWGFASGKFEKDNQGNELKPDEVEKPEWSKEFLYDASGYYTEPLKFYFSAGKHTVRLISQEEPMLLRELQICQQPEVPTYQQVSAQYKEKGYKAASGQSITVQAESVYKSSDPTFAPLSDRSSPSVQPPSTGSIRLNSVGGANWCQAGQWIEWKVSVPETGLYKIGMHVKQNWMQGLYVPRQLQIDGEVPFREMEEIAFQYDNDWYEKTLGDASPYLFYLTKGEHILRLKVVLGAAASILRNVQTSVTNLNDIYQQVIMLTGEDTDQWRDYQVAKNLPNLSKQIWQEYVRLVGVEKKIESLTGKNSDKEALIQTVTQQLNDFYRDVEEIPGKKDSFKTNIGSLGTWLTQVASMPLQVDFLTIQPPSAEAPVLHNTFWDRMLHQLKLLGSSFTTDYNAVGNVSNGSSAKSITVWIGTGRDQADTIKSLIDSSFTKQSGINVNLMLVPQGTLLQATLAGQGPDVAMQVTCDTPMNYGIRGAAADLSQFSDFQEVEKRFRSSAMLPFTFRGKTYALPETQTFNMLFYRKDILKKLNMHVPKTWDDVKADISVLSKNHMEFGMLPLNTAQQGGAGSSADISYGMFLYQNGGQFYTKDGKSSALDSKTAVNAFKEWVKYYQAYTLTREFDVQNRFRTGEAPLVVSDYTLYNTLQVAAPEIKGLWGFTEVPGTVQADGTVSHAAASTGTATIIMQNAKDKQSAWEFLKWWTSADVQTAYGRGMEALQGASARYPTANIEALKRLPWPAEDYNSIAKAFAHVQGIPQVPGSYYTARDIQNAFSTVVIDQTEDAREALMDNVKAINDEIASKREEFRLDS